jgi:hypothetical protein
MLIFCLFAIYLVYLQIFLIQMPYMIHITNNRIERENTCTF